MKKKINSVMIAGVKSGSGKTTITCCVLNAIKKRGINVMSFKCGPDYIDPMFHKTVIGVRSGNLDGFFLDKESMKSLYVSNAADYDMTLTEGVMGYYDGIGVSDKASSFDTAKTLNMPVIIVIDCKGMSNSILAVLKGFLEYRENSQIRGVIFNRLSQTLYEKLKEETKKMGIMPLGYVPTLKENVLKSRHLGLVTADEIINIKEKLDELTKVVENTVDIEGIIKLSTNSKEIEYDESFYKNGDYSKVKIAVAKDSAFCFIYDDNIKYLEERGASTEYFSPLRDEKLPEDIDGLIFSGGYPELYAKELSDNKNMLKKIREAYNEKMPIKAECGGFMYMHKKIQGDDLKEYEMAGIIDAECYKTEHLVRFGYVNTCALKDGLILKKGEIITAHEFHYWDSTYNGDDMKVTKVSNGKEYNSCILEDNIYAGFPHIYFYGNMDAVDNFLQKRYMHKKSKER